MALEAPLPQVAKVVEEPRERGRHGPDEPWEFGGVRPATPQAAAFGSPHHAAAPRHPRAAAAAAAGTPPARPGGLFKAARASSNSLTGLLKRAAASGEARGSPGGAPPLFELRGAAMLPPPDPPRPVTAVAAPSARHAAPHQHPSPSKQASPACSIHARAGLRPSGSPHDPPPSRRQQQQQQQPAVVAAHGLDLGASPQQQPAALSLAEQLQRQAAASPPAAVRTQPQQQQQQPQQQQPACTVAGQASALGATTVHRNPLYSGGSEDPTASQPAAAATQQRQRAEQQQAQPRAPPPVRVPAGGAARASLAGASALAASPLAPSLQAASNLTLASDSRPVSPGPFLSTLASAALTDSRPVSPQCADSLPATPGPCAAVAAAPATAAPADPLSRSLPASPSPIAQAAAALPQPAAGRPAAAAAAFRLPIFSQEGRLVGYKQNSHLLPRPGTCISSAPSSPTHGLAHSTASFPAAPQEAAAASSEQAAAGPAAGAADDFAEWAAHSFRGFPDAENMVPGYVLGPVLGKGGFCSVRRALHLLTGRAVACKIIEKGRLKDPKDRDRVDREVRVMRNLSNHGGVVRLYEACETPDCVYVFMEAAARGSLLDYVRERKRLPEDEAAAILQQLLHALQFCHRKDVVHRDVKLENILLDGGGACRLIDFGLCGYFLPGKRLRCHCGSPSYAAPEIVARRDYLGPPVDVWSLGVVLFAMLAGYLPFHAKEKRQLSEKILAGAYKPAAWMSAAAQDLLSRMLTLDPDQRITLDQVWQHPWVAGAPRWEPAGVGAGRLYRALTDPATGAVLPDEAVLEQLAALGGDVAATRRALRFRECNAHTAAYHLLLERRAAQPAPQQQPGAAAAVVAAREAAGGAAAAAPAAGPKPGAGAAGAADWHWDFGSSGGGVRGGSGQPARPRTAAAAPPPGSSPTRFGQEAAAAAAPSPCRPPTAGAGGGPAPWPPFAARQAGDAAPAPADPASGFLIKALHPAGGGEHGGARLASPGASEQPPPPAKLPCLGLPDPVPPPKGLLLGGAERAAPLPVPA